MITVSWQTIITAGAVIGAVVGIMKYYNKGYDLVKHQKEQDKSIKDIQSEYTGGLNRHINVYSYNGDKLAEYDGRIDIAERNDGVVKFQLKGKRYMYYNALVEVIEK